MTASIRTNRTNELLHDYTGVASAKRAFTRRGLDKSNYYIHDDDWRDREAARRNLIDVTQFGLIPVPDHFLHVSARDNPAESENVMISYTETPEKGARDRQASARRIGAYLTEFYPGIDVNAVANAITVKARGMDLRFGSSREEFRWVYEHSSTNHGTGSCMAYNANRWPPCANEGIHPVEAFAAGDLQIAYLVKDGTKVIARSVIWPEKKLYVRLYGQVEKLQALLHAQGYRQGLLDGAKMLKLELKNTGNRNLAYYALPYIDGSYRVRSVDDHWVIDRTADLSASDGGYISIERRLCAISNVDLSGQDWVTVYDDQRNAAYVHSQYQDDPQYIWLSPEGARWLRTGRFVDTAIGPVPYEYRRRAMRQCTYTGDWYPTSQLVNTEDGYVNAKTVVQHYARCLFSSAVMKRELMKELPNNAGFYFARGVSPAILEQVAA